MLNIGIDYVSDRLSEEATPQTVSIKGQATLDNGSREYPYKVYGDVFACFGGILYGVNDVLAEVAVRNLGGRNEYLGMLGLFGFFISVVQVAILERAQVVALFSGKMLGDCAADTTFGLLLVYLAAQTSRKVGITRFLALSEAALLNLSLLTSDLYTALFSVAFQHILPYPLFWVGLGLVLSGIFVYEIGPSPVIDKKPLGLTLKSGIDLAGDGLVSDVETSLRNRR